MIKCYWYDLIDDYVFEGLFNDKKIWALSDTGKIWYRQRKTKNFELVGKL